MRLYKMNTRYFNMEERKHIEACVGYVVADSDLEVFDRISQQFLGGKWLNRINWRTFVVNQREIVATKGDYEVEYWASTRYRWEDLGEVSADDVIILKRLNILAIW